MIWPKYKAPDCKEIAAHSEGCLQFRWVCVLILISIGIITSQMLVNIVAAACPSIGPSWLWDNFGDLFYTLFRSIGNWMAGFLLQFYLWRRVLPGWIAGVVAFGLATLATIAGFAICISIWGV